MQDDCGALAIGALAPDLEPSDNRAELADAWTAMTAPNEIAVVPHSGIGRRRVHENGGGPGVRKAAYSLLKRAK
jgi:hypothetical protein